MSYNNDKGENVIVKNVEDQEKCDEHNAALDDRAARRRAARTRAPVALRLPFSRNRAERRHKAKPLGFEPDPSAPWRGSRMFLQRDKNRAKGR